MLSCRPIGAATSSSRPTRSSPACISWPTRSPSWWQPRRCASALSLPKAWSERWIAGFARGLAADQRRYGIVLSGGDTVTTPGPLTVTVTAFGRVPHGRGLTRAGARAGDRLFVTGTIGDGALGLLAARGRIASTTLEKRYRLPQPRSALGLPLLSGSDETIVAWAQGEHIL